MKTRLYTLILTLSLLVTSCRLKREESLYTTETTQAQAVERLEAVRAEHHVAVRLSEVEAQWRRYYPDGTLLEEGATTLRERHDAQTTRRDTLVLTDTLYLRSEQVVQQTERREHRSGGGALPLALFGGLLLGITIGYQLWLRRR